MFRLVEWFWTFQGEGANAGRRALFIRMPYCNLKCPWCDTEYNKWIPVSKEEIVSAMQQEPTKFAVLTGGEPTMNKQLPELIALLKENGFEIAVETNGTFPIPDGINFVTVSPKRDAEFQIHADAALKCTELKLVVDKDFNFDIARAYESKEWSKYVRLSLSPEFNEMHINLERIEAFIKENPRWRISMQTHKWAGFR